MSVFKTEGKIMESWFKVKKSDVIAVIDKRKDCFPWGEYPDEEYHCLVFREDGQVRMCVDEFYESDSETFECLRYYTTIIGNKLEDYTNLTEDEFATIAYNAWCSGAR